MMRNYVHLRIGSLRRVSLVLIYQLAIKYEKYLPLLISLK